MLTEHHTASSNACSKRHAVLHNLEDNICLLVCLVAFCLLESCELACRCGAVTNVSPYREKLEDGVEVNKAWEQSKDEIDENSRYGTWKADYFLSKPDPTGRFCHATEIRSANAETFKAHFTQGVQLRCAQATTIGYANRLASLHLRTHTASHAAYRALFMPTQVPQALLPTGQ